MIVFTFPSLGFPSANRAIGAIILIVLGLLVRIFQTSACSTADRVTFSVFMTTWLCLVLLRVCCPAATSYDGPNQVRLLLFFCCELVAKVSESVGRDGGFPSPIAGKCI